MLRARGISTWLVSHARTRNELIRLLPGEAAAMRFVPDTVLHRALHQIGKFLPAGVAYWSTGSASRMLTQILAIQIIRDLHRHHHVDVVHQPIPVSPKEPS